VKHFLSVIFICIAGIGFSQGNKSNLGIITGNVLEAETGKAVADATITINNINDSTFKRNDITDKNGSFEMDKLPLGYYRLTVSTMGFSSMVLDSIYLRAERYDFNLGDLKLKRNSAQLTEVVVYAEKPLIENTDGKITYNVGESALSSGSSTAEILKSMPLINNDPNGKILLKGKEPKILIDDKPTDLTAQQLADLLESLPGSSIEKIELMTNPPAQYATEAGGVINIVTRKGKIGLVGKVTLSTGTRGEGNLASNISYRNKKFTLNTTAGIGASIYKGTNYSHRTNFYTDSSNYLNTDGHFENKNLRPNLRVQTDYDFDVHNNISAVIQSNYNFFDNYSFTQYSNLNRNSEIYKLSTRTNASNGDGYSNNLTLSYTFKGKNIAERLQLIASGTLGKNDNGKDYFQQFLRPDFTPTGVDSTQQQGYDYLSNALSFRVNYDKPLKWQGVTFSTGASFLRTNNHNVLNTTFFRKADQQFVENDLLSNNFKFAQDLYTVRGAVSFRLPKEWRVITGAQAEQTSNTFHFIKGNAADVTNTYWNILPTFTLRKDFNKRVNTSLVYRATIRRPGIGELNPSIDYTDPYNIRFGNPYLQPSLADNFDWNLGISQGKYYINASIGYNKIKNVYNTIRTLIGNGLTQVTYQNISDRQEYESSIWGGYTFSKKFRINTSAGYSYNKYGEEQIKLYKYRNGGTFYTSINYSFTPTNLTTLDGNARYSSYADPQGRARSNLQMNVGIQHKFFNKRLIVSFNAIDPIKVQKFVTYTYGANFNLENYNSTQTRNFRITVSYQLNKMVQKKKISDKEKNNIINKIKAKQGL
jgi:ferric enterobactin receptor